MKHFLSNLLLDITVIGFLIFLSCLESIIDLALKAFGL